MMNKKWGKRINWTDYINERAIATSTTVNKQRVLLMSVYFSPTRTMRTTTLKERTEQSRNTRNPKKKSTQIVGGDFNAELGPGFGVERVSVGPRTLKEGNKRGDWMKQWLVLQNFVALNTMYRKRKLRTGHRKV